MPRHAELARERETFKYATGDGFLLPFILPPPPGLLTLLAEVTDMCSRYKPAAIQGNHRYDWSQSGPPHAVQGCEDGALTAFAQLATFKLNASRAWISVFDRDFQYVVAEATRSLSLDCSDQDQDQLWICGTALPRADCICEHVLDTSRPRKTNIDPEPLHLSVVPDLTKDPRFQSRACMSRISKHRFYAGVPIRSSRGIDIGVLCVLDDEPRPNLDEASVKFMRDLSRIVMEHLEANRFGDAARRNIRMVRGLGSFVEGHSSLWGWMDSNASAFSPKQGAEGDLNPQQQLLQNRASKDEAAPSQSKLTLEDTAIAVVDKAHGTGHAAPIAPPQMPPPAEDISSDPSGSGTTRDPNEDHFLTQVQQVFSKAANIVRESLEVEGVLFLDASVLPFASLKPGVTRKRANSIASNASSSDDEDISQSPDTPEGICNILGFSTTYSSSIDNSPGNKYRVNVPERLLRTLLRRYKSGEIFNFEQDGSLDPGDSDESGEDLPFLQTSVQRTFKDYPAEKTPNEGQAGSRGQNYQHFRANAGRSIIRIIPGARSVAIVPLWDSQKERWFASGIIWTKSPSRSFTRAGEMSYLRAFGTSIMAEVSRINTLISEKAKTDVLESLSHELRSPLHGIVAGGELLRDTQLDTFQQDVLHTLECSGRTLLDVIDHLLDYAKINRFRQSPKTPHDRRALDRRDSFEGSILSKFVDVDLAALTEESIESVYAGHNFQKLHAERLGRHKKSGTPDRKAMQQVDIIKSNGDSGNSRTETDDSLKEQYGGVSVYLDMDANANWLCYTQPGALRRIIMNLFGNSLKYTKRGFIHITLRLEKTSNQATNLHFTIRDSGVGIGDDFLRHRMFTPFSQEDQLTSGTGLGLTVVYRTVGMLKGTINVESKVNVGTTVKVTLPIHATEEPTERDEVFANHVSALSGLRVDISGVDASAEITDRLHAPLHVKHISERRLVETMCRDWLHMEVVRPGQSDIKADLMICSDGFLDEIAARVSAEDILPPTVVICHNAVLAHKRGSSLKPTSRISVAEFVSRPTAPRKMARALITALGLYAQTKQLSIAPLTGDARALPLTQIQSTGTHIINPEVFRTAKNGSDRTKPLLTVSEELPPPRKLKEWNCDIGPTLNETKLYLLVDDNKINLKILTALMGKLNRPYKTATNGLEALEFFSAEPDRYCCILMDISMPIMDGLESTRHIRDLERRLSLKSISIFALTGLASAETQKEAFASGIDIFLTKPVRFNNLAKHLLERGL
ncbi:hypothetical protein SLS62_001773 [Diatrype stigma]|uniref:Uncharacterized protein n=1 Tax=Diatrype stigma TaxID=117547 RepID=A0AAN9UVF1_9PEZI